MKPKEEEEEDVNDDNNNDNEEEEDFFLQKCLKWPNIPACQIWWGYLNRNKLVITWYYYIVVVLPVNLMMVEPVRQRKNAK